MLRLKKAFDVLGKANLPLHEPDKVKHLLNRIQSQNILVQTGMMNVHQSPTMSINFNMAASSLSELISITAPTLNLSAKAHYQIAGVETGQGCGGGERGHGSGRG